MKFSAIIRNTIAALSLLGMISLGPTAQAQTATPGVTKNQVKAQKSIKQGVRTGELTRKETRDLQRQQRRIQRTKKRAKADGQVTTRERALIRARQQNAKRNIRIQKNDAQSRH